LKGIPSDMIELIVLLTTGFAVGVLGYLLGIGGGALIVPILVLMWKMPIHNAIATSLIAVTAVSIAAASVNIPRKVANIRLGVLLEFAAVVGAIIGALIGVKSGAKFLTFLFAAILFLTGLLMFLKKNPSERVEPTCESGLNGIFFDHSIGKEVCYTAQKIGLSSFACGFAGFISGLLGVGGGIFKVPAMNMVSKVPIKAATATSNFMIGITAAVSAFIYLMAGYVDPLIACVLVMGVVVGSLFSTVKLKKIQDKKIKFLFIFVVWATAIQMIYKVL